MLSLLLVLPILVQVLGEDLNFLILHNNDIHGRFEETSRISGTCNRLTPRNGTLQDKQGCVGGFARTANRIRKYRKMAEEGGAPVVYMNAGDTYVGTAWFGVHRWRICQEFMDALKPEVASLGNHEFDFGVSALAPFVNSVHFPTVCANIDLSKEPSLARINKSVVLDIAGRKVGVVGHLTTETVLMSSPENVIFLDVVESVKKEAEVLDKSGIKIIVALGHSGYEMDKRIAAEVPLVDVVIGGHTNTFLWNGPQPDIEKPEDLYPKVITQPSGKKVPVVQAYAYTKYLGILNVTFDDAGNLIHFQGQPELLDTHVPQDADILDLLEKYRPAVDALDVQVVGKSRVLLEATANKCRFVECNFGNMLADSLVYYMAGQHTGPGWTDTPIGLLNGGGIRTTIDPRIRGGNITRGELMGSLPFSNQILSMTLNGSDLIKTLEIGARSNGETSRGEFLQVSGLKVVYDKSKPSYSRVVSVAARCGNCSIPIYEPLVPGRMYRVVTTSFLSGGGDGHHRLRDATNKKTQDLDDVETAVWYLERQNPVYPEENGRIQFVEKGDNEDPGGDKPSAGDRRAVSSVGLLLIVLVFNFVEIR